ncbi:MAG: MBOAT family protein [Anaerolineae bacterium]|nr:MBOAT family protein [Anaerolineae bacterium]
MLFNSIEFLIFFPLVVAVYFATPHRYRWLWLLAASYYFYMSWKAEYLILIVVSTLIGYFTGLRMGKIPEKSNRKKLLILSLCANLGILFAFKYFNFFNDSLRAIFNQLNLFYNVPVFQVLLPVGISFYTFQILSYSLDVYRGHKEPEKHLGIFALYVAFFPQLVAGPIERSTRLLPQFFEHHHFNYQRAADGVRLMAWGFFKKIVIADRLALIVNDVYNHPTEYTGMPLIIATYFFAFQIYCDFSGYSDIAIGAAKVMGFDLMQNFNRPYFAKSIREFWQRWHISLSSWFRDYVYIPLGGNRVTQGRWYFNLMVVFLLSSLWHGAAWTFVVWGGLHGLYLLVSIWTAGLQAGLEKFLRLDRAPLLQKLIRVGLTFNLVSFAWIFFRANSIADAFYIVRHLLVGLELKTNYGLAGGFYGYIFGLVMIIFLLAVQVGQRRGSIRQSLALSPVWLRWAVYYVFIFTIFTFGYFGTTEFIYFQF